MLDSAGIAIATVSSVLIVIAIVGNYLVCVIIKKNRDMRTSMNYLLVNLAVADILYAAFIAPDVILRLTFIHPDGITGTVLCKTLTGGTVAWIGAASSVVTLAAIATERYYSVVYPLGNDRKLTECKLKVIIVASWIFSSIFCVPIFLIKNVKSHVCISMWPQAELSKAYHWVWLIFIVLSMAIMIGFYSRIVYTLWFERDDDSQVKYQQRGVMKVRKRVTLMVVTVTALFSICWLTDTVVHVVEDNSSYAIDKNVYTVIHTLILFSSAANPFVYALLNQTFREKIKKVMFCTRSTAVIPPATRALHAVESAENTQPTHTTRPCFME